MGGFSRRGSGRCVLSLAVALLLMVACIPHQPQPGADLAKLLIDLSVMPDLSITHISAASSGEVW